MNTLKALYYHLNKDSRDNVHCSTLSHEHTQDFSMRKCTPIATKLSKHTHITLRNITNHSRVNSGMCKNHDFLSSD